MDDVDKYQEIIEFIPEDVDFLLPIIICPLLNSCVDTGDFNKVISKLKENKNNIVIFTNLEGLMSGARKIVADEN